MTDATREEGTTAAPADTSMTEADQDRAFEAGFTGTDLPEPQSKPTPAESKEATPSGEPTEPAAAQAPAAQAKPAPFAITEEQWNKQVAAHESLKQELAEARQKLTGSLGVVQQAVAAMKAGGSPVKVTKDLLKKLNEGGYGELSELLAEDLSEVLKAAVGPAAPAFDVTAFEKTVGDKLAEAGTKQSRALSEAIVTMHHPDFRETYKTPEFQAWKATHPAHIQQKLDSEWEDYGFLVKALNAFKKHSEEQAAAKKKADAEAAKNKTARLEAAAPATNGKGAPPAKGDPDEDAAFEAGFKSVHARA